MSDQKAIVAKVVPVVPVVNGRMVANDLEGVRLIAHVLFTSRLLPSSIDSPEKAFVLCNAANELGIGYTEAITGIGVISGRPVLHSRLPMSLAIRTGQFAGLSVDWSGAADKLACKVTVKRRFPNVPDLMEFVGEFSMADAQRANLLNKEVWKTYPKDMLLARAKSRALGLGFADALGGMGIVQPEDEDRAFAPTTRVVVNEAGPAAATADAIDALSDGEPLPLPDGPPERAGNDFGREMAAAMDSPPPEKSRR